MDSEKAYTENTEQIGTHREILFDNFNSLQGNKWGKENHKFFRDFGSSPCLPCTKNEDQVMQYKQDPNPRKIRNS